MNELRHQINSQLKAQGASQGLHYKSFQHQRMSNEQAYTGSYAGSTKQSSKTMAGVKKATDMKKEVDKAHMKSSGPQGPQMAHESLQMKINKKRILSSSKHQGAGETRQPQAIQGMPGHQRIVSNPINFNQESMAQMHQIITKPSRKNLTTQQSQSKLRNADNAPNAPVSQDGAPTQQILKLRAAALVPPQSMLVNKGVEKDARTQTQVNFPTKGTHVKKGHVRQGHVSQVPEMHDQQITAQILQGLNTINNDINSRQQVHEHQVGNVPMKKGNHAKAFSMSSYVLQKQQPRTHQVGTVDASITHTQKKQAVKATAIANHQKSHGTFTGNFQVPTSFDARKTFHNHMTSAHLQGFPNTEASQASLTYQKSTLVQKKQGGHQMYRQYPNHTQVPSGHTTGGGTTAHQYHRRILSQQNPTDNNSTPGNIEQFINSSDIGNAQLASSGKIVVINNNNTNINIHQQSPPYQIQHGSQYPQISGKQAMHKKNNQSYHVPTHSVQHLMQKASAEGTGSMVQAIPIQQKKGTKVTGFKAYTHAHQSIKSSINNSVNSGLLSQDQLTALNPTHGMSYMNEDDVRSNVQLSAKKQSHADGLLTQQQPPKKMHANNMLVHEKKKQQIKRVNIDSWIRSNGQGATLPEGETPVQMGQHVNLVKEAHRATTYGGITTVGSMKSIGEQIKGASSGTTKVKTRQTSNNTKSSAQRGAAAQINQKNEIWLKQTVHRNSNANASSKMASINSKNQQQIQKNHGDSNFLNSERSSQNPQRDIKLVKELKDTSSKYTIQYSQNQNHGKYMMMFHNTQDHSKMHKDESSKSSKLKMKGQANSKMNSLSTDSLQHHDVSNLVQSSVQQSYFNMQIDNRSGNGSKVGNNPNSGSRVRNQVQTQQMESKNQKLIYTDKYSPIQKKSVNDFSKVKSAHSPVQQNKRTATHERGNSMRFKQEVGSKMLMTKQSQKAVHRKVESMDQYALNGYIRQQDIYGVNKKQTSNESDHQKYLHAKARAERYAESENAGSEKIQFHNPQQEQPSSRIGSSEMSNRKKMKHLEKSVPVHEISLQGSVSGGEPTVPSELKRATKVIKSPPKQNFPQGIKVQSPQSAKTKTKSKDQKPSKNATGLTSGALTPRKLIINSILSNIRDHRYETKIDYYKIGKVIGKGAFGKVNLAIHRLTGKFVALKSINKTFMKDENSLKKVRQEYNILKRARHQNIVRLYESFEIPTHIVYVMEVCGGGDLLTYVRRRRKLKEDYAKFIFRQIIQGIHYVHSKGVLHRDIKLDNILLTSEGDVKICDFGVSKIVQNSKQLQTEQCGTPAYIAPEVFRGKGYRGFQSDVWSAGVVLYAMLFGTVPFKATNMAELQAQIINLQCSWGTPGEISAPSLAFLKRVLEVDPAKRLTPVQILNDPWMYLSEAQMTEISVFTDNEKQKVVSEFMYYTTKAEDKNDDPFLEQELQTTQNSEYRNVSTKSIILAPFNSTRTHLSDNYLENEGILPLIVDRECLQFADKCREVNRQYMLNNNAELDNGVYNENSDEEKQEEEKKEDDAAAPAHDNLVGLNEQIESRPDYSELKQGSQVAPNQGSNKQSLQPTANHSLNTSQIILDDERVDEVVRRFGYEYNYLVEQIENDELNHATTCYSLINQTKEF